MRLKINNKIQGFYPSSKHIKLSSYLNDNIDNIQDNDCERSFNIKNNTLLDKSNEILSENNNLLNYSPPIHPIQLAHQNISMNNFSINDQSYLNSKKPKNMHIGFTNTLKKNNNLFQINYAFGQKQSNNLNKSKLSIADKIQRQQQPKTARGSFQPSIQQSTKTNLKLIQKEIQFKLLDMSMNIDNNINPNEEENIFSNPKKDNSIFLGKNVKNELESYKNEISNNIRRRKSVNLNHIRKMNSLNNFYDKCLNNLNKSINDKELNNCLNNNIFNNINSFRNSLSIINPNNTKKNRRKSFNFGNKLRLRNNINNMSAYRNNISFSNLNNKSMNINNKSMSKMLLNSYQNLEYENKYRIIKRNKELYDSLEDEEVVEELEKSYHFISPETHRIFIFDVFLLLCILFCSFYYPIYIAYSVCFCSWIPLGIKVVLFLTDILTILDILISFFRAFYNFDYTLIKDNQEIVIHYLKQYFFFDLISAIPVFSYSSYLCKKNNIDGNNICITNYLDLKLDFVKMCLTLKIIKIFKVMDKKSNRGINYFYEKISENYTLEKIMKMVLFALMCILGFNLFICYHIYIGKNNYPNWIISTNNQNKEFLSLYLVSLYFLLTTITSVGYGDITCASFVEVIFQIIILTIGVIAYSWVVSTIGNYVKKETKAAIKYNKDICLLEEIRISYPKMCFKLYNKIKRHLETVSHQTEKFDTNLLVNNLPYSLKNQLMFIIYGTIIKKFSFFKECDNSDFILRILTSFIPMSAKKGAFVIHEGELVDNIIFVKEGRLSLVAAIDLESPLQSIENYLGEKFEDINDKMDTEIEKSFLNQSKNMNIGYKIEKTHTEIKNIIKMKNEFNESNIKQEIGKCDFDDDEFDVGNHQFLNILDILKNEHYGEVYMFLQKPSPLSLRVKSKYSELFLLRKQEALLISKAYPNVWKKIYHKSYHNMKSIKKLTEKIIINFGKNYGNKYDTKKFLELHRQDSDTIITNLEELNSKEKKRRIKLKSKKKSNLKKSSFSKNIILNHKLVNFGSNNGEGSPIERKSNFIDNKFQNQKKNFLFHLNGKKLNQIYRINKMKTLNVNSRNSQNFNVPSSNNKFANTMYSIYSNNKKAKLSNNMLFQKTTSNSILDKNFSNNKISMNKASNLNNNEDNSKIMDSTFKINSNYDDKNKTVMNNNIFHKLNSNIAVGSNTIMFKNRERSGSITISSLSNQLKTKPLEKGGSQQIMNDTNLNDTKIMYSSNSKNTVLTQKVDNDESSDKKEEAPNTIQNLSKPLIKKIQKKMEKRRKKKRLYKILLSKIRESLIKINPNGYLSNNLNSSINNSFNNLSSKNGTNIQLGNGLQTSYILQDNSMISDRIVDMNKAINMINEQELLIIPESPEFDSESSSDNSKGAHKSNSISNVEKKKIELSISENISFSYCRTYENLNSISEGSYSKDISLQNSVSKLIGFYLKEKMLSKNKTNSNFSCLTLNKKDKEKSKDKSKEKEKDKEKNSILKKNNKNSKKDEKKEEDVWAFLNEEEDTVNQNIKFNLNASDSKDSSEEEEKYYSRISKGKSKRNLKIKSRFMKNSSNIYDKENTGEFNKSTTKKKTLKKKAKKGADLVKFRGCTTIVSPKKAKKQNINKDKYKSNKIIKVNNNLNKKENISNNNDTSSSLNLTISENMDKQETYIKNLYKTFHSKKNNAEDHKYYSKHSSIIKNEK